MEQYLQSESFGRRRGHGYHVFVEAPNFVPDARTFWRANLRSCQYINKLKEK